MECYCYLTFFNAQDMRNDGERRYYTHGDVGSDCGRAGVGRWAFSQREEQEGEVN